MSDGIAFGAAAAQDLKRMTREITDLRAALAQAKETRTAAQAEATKQTLRARAAEQRLRRIADITKSVSPWTTLQSAMEMVRAVATGEDQ